MRDVVKELAAEIPVSKACAALDYPRSSLYWSEQPPVHKARPKPSESVRSLSVDEKETVRSVLNSERFYDSSPRQVYATLLDEGVYHCHWRTMYRILDEYDEVRERRNQLNHPVYQKPELLATAPNQVWSWDITSLKGPVKGSSFYLYVVLDIYSRYIVGWLIAQRESEELARDLIGESCHRHEISEEQLTLHADRGAPMIAKNMTQLLEDLGVKKSHSRPRVSNDNPFSESQFRTMKYRPDYPARFGSIQDARTWARSFFHWYNHQHRHTGIALMAPATVHQGLAEQVTQQRQQVLETAYQRHPERFVKGAPTPPQLPDAVWINPPDTQIHARSDFDPDTLPYPAVPETQSSAQPVLRESDNGSLRPLTPASTGPQ